MYFGVKLGNYMGYCHHLKVGHLPFEIFMKKAGIAVFLPLASEFQ